MRAFELQQPNLPKKIIRYELSAGVAQDIYEKNYSTVKSPYGLDSLGDGTFTGDSILGYDGSPATVIYTDTGEVLINESRYRDTSAIATLISIDTNNASISTSPTSDSDTWIDSESGDSLSRYIKSDVDTVVTIDMGPSLISSYLTETPLLANIFPSWTSIYSSEVSNGQKLLNALGLDIEEIKKQAISWAERGYITHIPTEIKSFAHLSELYSLEKPIDVIGYYDTSPATYFPLSMAEDLKEFIEAEETQHLYWIEDRQLFTCGEYDTLVIDTIEHPQEKVIIRNFFDHIGDYCDLPRLPDETNTDYKARLIDVFANPPGASVERFQTAVERESGCTISNVWELKENKLPWETNDPLTSGYFYPEPSNEHVDIAK